MATTIVTKSGSGAPTASDLVAGELAVDLTNKRLYTEDSGGTVLELGTNPSGNVTFGDNGKAIFGAASDLQIYHDGFNSYIKDTGTGDLRIWADSPNISTASGNKIFFGNNGSAELYTSGGALRLATTATGIDVTGNISLPDNGKATFGASDDLQIYHDGSHSYIKDAGTGQLRLLAGTNVQIWNADATNLAANFNGDTQTSLYYAGSSKLSTTASGIDVTGTVTAEALGIGGSPIAALDVTGTDAVGSLTSLADTVTRAAAIVRGSTHANGYGLYMGYGNASTDAQYIQSTLKTGAQAYPLLLNPYGGNVGISTSSPQKTLHVNSGTSNIGLRVESSDATASIEFIDSGTTSTATSARVGGISNDFFVQTNGSERLRISAAGQLFLNVTAEVAAGYIASIKCAAGTGGVIIQNSSTAGVPLSFRDTSASQIGSVSTTNTATAYNTSSDQRLKENIADADDAGSKVDSIQVRKFDWKADGSHQDYGMVAQELLEVAPEAVHQPQDSEEMMGVDYSKLVPMMLKEIQSLRARMAALES
jgi:hypothetical protein